MSRIRNWVFTIHNYTQDDIDHLNTVECKYLVYGLEEGSHETPHIQGYIELENPKSMGAMKKLLNRNDVHLEKRMGTAKQASEYCKKEGHFYEKGEMKKQGERTDLVELAEQVRTGEVNMEQLREDNPMAYHTYGRTLEKIEDDRMRKTKREWMTKGTWLYGPTGVGKSHRAYEMAEGKSTYVYTEDGRWWDAYKGEEVVIIDDFRGSIPYNQLLKMIDKWEYKVPRRGREPMMFLAKEVIITSALHPKDVYKNLAAGDNLNQLYRRVEIVKCTEVGAQKSPEGNTRLLVDDI